MERIDNLDRQILEIISQNARIPFKDVAAECGVSRAAIHQRVQRLIDLGVIVGSGYHVNPEIIGLQNMYIRRYQIGKRLYVQSCCGRTSEDSRNCGMSFHYRTVHYADQTCTHATTSI